MKLSIPLSYTVNLAQNRVVYTGVQEWKVESLWKDAVGCEAIFDDLSLLVSLSIIFFDQGTFVI